MTKNQRIRALGFSVMMAVLVVAELDAAPLGGFNYSNRVCDYEQAYQISFVASPGTCDDWEEACSEVCEWCYKVTPKWVGLVYCEDPFAPYLVV